MKMLNSSKVTIILISALYFLALVTVALSAHTTAYSHLLQTLTQESSLFETLSVLFLLVIAFYGIRMLISRRIDINGVEKFLIAGLSLFALFAAMEEISWGQHLFHFQSSDYFLEENIQKETNLHNLMDANLFSSIVYSSVYALLVYLPLLYKIFPSFFSHLRYAYLLDVSPHTILVVLFASVFQIYFYNDLGVMMDMLTHFGGLILFGIYLWCKGGTIWLKLHYGTIILATMVSMISYKAYSFFNMQYEIREMFVILAVLFIFIETVQKENNETHSMDNR